MKTSYEPTILCDFYKFAHRNQFPTGTELVVSNWIPRMSRIDGIKKVVAFGAKAFSKEWLIDYFNIHFFSRPKEDVVEGYRRFIKYTMFVDDPEVSHIEELHDLGYLPLKIKAVKEGTLVPLRVPMLTIENTKPNFFWLPNYFESIFSNQSWQASTSATLSFEMLKILTKNAEETNGDLSSVPFQAHDFSFRGMGGFDASLLSGAGHLTAFVGTDTAPAIAFMEKHYKANIEKELVGTSIPATEHSVMCANGKDEYSSFHRLITEVHPNGFVSIVADTWDFWNVIDDVIFRLKDTILKRDGRVVIRPDSGDPILIMCGNPDGETESERKGLVETLWDMFGGTITAKGYKQLDTHIGTIYGDSITLERMREICKRLKAKGFASTNVVFGMGSYTFQYNTRDTFGFAMKATYIKVNGEEKLIYKDPKTDDGTKRSLRGMVAVLERDGELVAIDGLYEADYKKIEHEDKLEVLFEDGKLIRDESLTEIRDLIQKQLKKELSIR